MESLLSGKRLIFVQTVMCALQLARSQSFRQFLGNNAFFPVVPSFTTPGYQQFVPFQGQAFNSWNSGPAYFTRAPAANVQKPVVISRFQNNLQQHVPNMQANNQNALPSNWRAFRTYNSPINNNHFVPLITRPPPTPPTKISVVNGPLNKISPYPRRRTLKAKRRFRYRLVAKAKSFPGILKDTSLDVTKLRQ